jgi:RNA polymerase sigma-70 factor (ECF subfamily)
VRTGGHVLPLDEPYRTAIQLTSLQGLTEADAATRVGVSVSGMKSRVQRGRERLRQMLVRCCSIDVDVRGGVSDFHLRAPGACGDPRPAASTTSSCGTEPCSSSDGATAASNTQGQRLQH